MTDFSRIADDEDAEGAALLRAARGDLPPSHLLERTLAAVAAVAVVSSVSGAAAAKVAKVGSAAILKYALVGFASGVVVVGSAATIHHVASKPLAVEAPLSVRIDLPAAKPERAPEPTPTAEMPPAVAPLPDAGHVARTAHRVEAAREAMTPPAPSSTAVVAADSAMEVEVRLLDEARRKLAEGRGRDALDALARYAREAPSQRLAPEAFYLEMEANRALGDRVAAQRSARNLLGRYPQGPQASRARRILAGE